MNETTHPARSRFRTNTLLFGVALLIIGLPTLVSAQKVAVNEATLVSEQKVAVSEAQNKKLIREAFPGFLTKIEEIGVKH
jgi:hypothetical protein